MADKIIWIMGNDATGFAVRMDGRILEANLPYDTILRRAERMARFVEEGDQSVELRQMQGAGHWRVIDREPSYHPTPMARWATRLLRTA